jgi:opacity protein-like surface antigen
MKTFPFAAAAWFLASGLAAAQEPASKAALTRADVHFVIGWQNLHKAQPSQDSYRNDWVNGIFYGGAGAGWYWTDHMKTQVDLGAGTEGHQYRYQYTTLNGQSTSTSSRASVRQQSVAIAQHYQFFRNQWFHPHVGAGIELARETTREEYQPVVAFDSVTHVSRQISPERTEGPVRRTLARPFVETGFKAYMTPRAFFTGDARVMVRHGIDEVLFRLGFGVDF